MPPHHSICHRSLSQCTWQVLQVEPTIARRVIWGISKAKRFHAPVVTTSDSRNEQKRATKRKIDEIIAEERVANDKQFSEIAEWRKLSDQRVTVVEEGLQAVAKQQGVDTRALQALEANKVNRSELQGLVTVGAMDAAISKALSMCSSESMRNTDTPPCRQFPSNGGTTTRCRDGELHDTELTRLSR